MNGNRPYEKLKFLLPNRKEDIALFHWLYLIKSFRFTSTFPSSEKIKNKWGTYKIVIIYMYVLSEKPRV